MLKKYLKYVHYIFLVYICNLSKCFRINGINIYYPYNRLKAVKNIHEGKRCFIVGTGPSLDVKQLDLLKNEYTFSMNSIVLSFKDTEWRPTYYVIQDGRAYRTLKEKIDYYNMENVFIGISNRFRSIFINKISNKNFNRYYYFPVYPFPEKDIKELKFSSNCYEQVYDGATITYSIMQLAVYMGFKEIYLLGIDCDYTSKGKKNIVEYVKNNNGIETENKMLSAYVCAKKYADKHNIKIYNASEKGKLNIFEKKQLCKILV